MPEDLLEADLLIEGVRIITMDAERRVYGDGALAVAGDRIVAVGKREEIAPKVRARERRDGRRFVATPGFIDGHIHITGDPLTRGFARGAREDTWGEKLSRWVIPIFKAQTPEEERVSAQCAAISMVRYGTTAFVEAGTVIHLDAVMDGLANTGIRGRVGAWVEGRAFDPAADAKAVSDKAIAILEDEVARYPDRGDSLLAAWPVLVGHSTNSDDVWRAAKAIADSRGVRVSAHMSPRQSDPDWFLANYGRRPLEHLEDIGVLGPNVCLTHLAAINTDELDCLVRSGANTIHCPHAAVQGAMGVTRIGLFPEMVARGVNVLLGTDGIATDILSAARLMASVFRDAREDEFLFPAGLVLELATLNGARGMGLEAALGSLEAGKKADFVLHDAETPEWGAMFDPVTQLAMGASPAGVHSVWINGVQVLDAGRMTLIDEEKVLAEGRAAGAAAIARTGLPNRPYWPVL